MQKHSSYQARKLRVRSRIKTSGRPRLSVYRTNMHIWAQLIDDKSGVTLASANSKALKLKEPKLALATKVGSLIAQLAKAQKITKIVFDRGAYKYHGRVKALADAARAEGLEF